MRKSKLPFGMPALQIPPYLLASFLAFLPAIILIILVTILRTNVLIPMGPVGQIAQAMSTRAIEPLQEPIFLPMISSNLPVPTSVPTPMPEVTVLPTDTPVLETIEQECRIANFPGEIQQWCELIEKWAGERGLDSELIAALIWVESRGNEGAISRSGAVGLMQVMPSDGIAAGFQCANGPCFGNRPTIEELLRPNFNIEYGTGMLAGLIKHYGTERDGLKHYGPSRNNYSYVDLIYATQEKFGD